MLSRLAFVIFGLISLSANIAQGLEPQKDYLFLQLQNPRVSIPTMNGTKTPASQNFWVGPGEVEATELKVRWQASGLEVGGNRLQLGNILGQLRVGHLFGRAYYQSPEFYWHWGPRVRWHQHVNQLFDLTTLGVGLITKHSVSVDLPTRFQLKMKFENGRITRELLNRDEVNQFLSAEVDRLFNEATFAGDFNTYTIGVNAYLDGMAQSALTHLTPLVSRTVRDSVKDNLTNPQFVDSILDEVFQKLPPLRFTEGATASLEWTRAQNGSEPVWNLVYSKAGTSPSTGLVEGWTATGDAKQFNRFRLAVTPEALQHLIEETVGNFQTFQTPADWPSSLTVDSTNRELVYRPQSAKESSSIRLAFFLLDPRYSVAGDPDLVLSIDWAKHDNFKFHREGPLLVLEAKLQVDLASQRNSSRTPWIPLQLRAWFKPDCSLSKFEVRPISNTASGPIELFDLGPAMGSILQQALGMSPQAASGQLSRFARLDLLGTDSEVVAMDFIEPLPIP